jgi:hypothetical protein
MRRLLAGLVVTLAATLAVAGCGGSTSGAGGTGGGATTAPAVTNGELPAGSSVLFGTAYDPATLAVAGKATNMKSGSTMVAVGRALAPMPAAGVTVVVGAGGSAKPPRPVTVFDNPDSALFFAVDLTADQLGAGTWIVSFVSPDNRIIASGYLTVSP